MITDLKNSIESFRSRLDRAGERMYDLEDRTVEIAYAVRVVATSAPL